MTEDEAKKYLDEHDEFIVYDRTGTPFVRYILLVTRYGDEWLEKDILEMVPYTSNYKTIKHPSVFRRDSQHLINCFTSDIYTTCTLEQFIEEHFVELL